MQKWLENTLRVEIISHGPEVNIGNVNRGSQLRVRKRFQQTTWQDEHRRDAAERQGGDHGRKKSTYAPQVEHAVAETPLLQLLLDVQADEVTGNHKENVHPEKTAGKTRYIEVKKQDRKDGNSAQQVDIDPSRPGSGPDTCHAPSPFGIRRFLSQARTGNGR